MAHAATDAGAPGLREHLMASGLEPSLRRCGLTAIVDGSDAFDPPQIHSSIGPSPSKQCPRERFRLETSSSHPIRAEGAHSFETLEESI
jgi:hypothetical protein